MKIVTGIASPPAKLRIKKGDAKRRRVCQLPLHGNIDKEICSETLREVGPSSNLSPKGRGGDKPYIAFFAFVSNWSSNTTARSISS